MPANFRPFRCLIVALLLLAVPTAARAHGGEDHGAPAAPAPVATQAETGFGADGTAFQAVVAVQADGRHSLIYLADADSNAPVAAAAIEVEAGAWRGQAQPTGTAGIYQLDWAPADAQVDLTLTVSAGGQDDLILVTVAPRPAGTTAPAQPETGLLGWMAASAAGLLLLAGFVAIARRRRAAALTMLALWLGSGGAWAHSGHDHGAPAQDQPAAQPGLQLTMPKATQFMLGIRTARVEAREAADTVRVIGRVVPDPDFYARVQPSQPARIVSDPAIPFPVPGRQVRRGQVLLVLEPTLTSLERGDKRAMLSKVDSEIAILERELARQEALIAVTPAKLIEQSRIRLDQLRKERIQLAVTALGRETVTAPVDGIVADVHVVPGEVVGTDKVLVEIVDPNRLRVDAIIHDLGVAERVTAATAATRLIPDEAFRLTLLGISPGVDPVDQGVHAQFAVSGAGVSRLKLRMPVDVYLATGATRMSTSVPREAVAEVNGRQVLFVRTAPETFEARPVKVGRVVGPLAEIVEGVRAGERVVIQGVEQIKAAR